MRYLVVLGMILTGFWSLHSGAEDLPMKFRIKNFGLKDNVEKSVVWNPTTQEAMIRMAVVPSYIDPFFEKNDVNFMTATGVQMIPLDKPELTKGCDQVSQWQFEYHPGLPDYLLFITLKGPNCLAVATSLETYNTSFRFLKVATQADPVDVELEISR